MTPGIAVLLIILLDGQPLENVMIFHATEACDEMGASLVQAVKETIPERGARMTYSCKDILVESEAK